MSAPAVDPREQEKANLARIRDNQRRSRARRKEYLQELEQRLRMCELQGVEASAEIQMAARKVAEENKKLRTLLNRHGVVDDSIDAFLQSGIVAPPSGESSAIPHQYRTGAAAAGGQVQTLEQLMAPRRPACLDPSTPFNPPGSSMASGQVGAGGSRSREASVASVSTGSNTMWETTIPTTNAQQSRSIQPQASSGGGAGTGGGSGGHLGPKMASPHAGFISPTHPATSSVNRTEAAIALSGLGSGLEPPRGGGNASVSPGSTTGAGGCGGAPGPAQATQAYNFDGMTMPLHSPSPYSTQHHHHQHPHPHHPQQHHQQHPQHHPHKQPMSTRGAPPPGSNTLYIPTTTAHSHMSTDLMSTMGGDPHAIRTPLNLVSGMDGIPAGDVNDSFNTSAQIDHRYTATTIGM